MQSVIKDLRQLLWELLDLLLLILTQQSLLELDHFGANNTVVLQKNAWICTSQLGQLKTFQLSLRNARRKKLSSGVLAIECSKLTTLEPLSSSKWSSTSTSKLEPKLTTWPRLPLLLKSKHWRTITSKREIFSQTLIISLDYCWEVFIFLTICPMLSIVSVDPLDGFHIGERWWLRRPLKFTDQDRFTLAIHRENLSKWRIEHQPQTFILSPTLNFDTKCIKFKFYLSFYQ